MPARTLPLTLTMCWIAIVCSGATDPFIGKWKLNAARSQLADQITIQAAGKNMYILTFTGSVETETVIADGTDQPGIYGTTLSLTVEETGTWKIVRKKKGQTVLSAMTLTSVVHPAGQRLPNTLVFDRD